MFRAPETFGRWASRHAFGVTSRTPIPHPRLVIEEADSGLLEGCLDLHQGRDVAHNRRRGRLFGLFWPLTLAQSHTWATAVLVDEFEPPFDGSRASQDDSVMGHFLRGRAA
jgi:hypothetical protein